MTTVMAKKPYDPEQLIGGPAVAPVNRANDMVRVFPKDEMRRYIVEGATQLPSTEIHGSESKSGAGLSFSVKEFQDKYKYNPVDAIKNADAEAKKGKKDGKKKL